MHLLFPLLGVVYAQSTFTIDVPLTTSPGINPKLAFDPRVYSMAVVGYDVCPGMEQFGNRQEPFKGDCRYFTFNPKNRDKLQGYLWKCDPGHFCLGAEHKQKCTPGFYCPKDTVQPTVCPAGFYCSRDATTIARCPSNFYCPLGTIKPLACNYLANCPEGSKTANKFVILLLMVLGMVIVWFIFKWKQKLDDIKRLKLYKKLNSQVPEQNMGVTLESVSNQFDIEFDNLGLTLGNGMEIMSGVSGHLHSGRCCAIMGPSGSGKTTFMTVLMGKQKRTSGTIRINGKEQELSKFKKLMGYVPQEDIMLRELTVRDILMFSAKMRLPADWKESMIIQKVSKIIDFLGLNSVADSIIGDESHRGISGGQRKRVNIGMELVAEPSILFLDEPTSGLDSSSSFQVCEMLRQIARQKRMTIAAVVHSPSPATFNQFDDLLLFGKGGKIVYFGPREDATAYFDLIGFSCPPNESPSDFFMDVITGRVENAYDFNFHPDDLLKYWNVYREGRNPFENCLRRMDEGVTQYKMTRSKTIKREIQKKSSSQKMRLFVNSFLDIFRDIGAWWADVSGELASLFTSPFKKDPVRETPNMLRQFAYCAHRSFYQVYRSAQSFISEMILHLEVGIFVSIAIQEMTFIGGNPLDVCLISPGALQMICIKPFDTLKEAGMFISLGCMFAGISVGSSSFGKEKVVYWRDTATGMSTIAYFLGKLVVDVPRMILGGIVFGSAITLMFPFTQSWITLLGIVLSMYLVSFMMGYALSYVFNQKTLALAGAAFALFWSLVLSGVVPTLENINKSDSLLKKITFLWHISPPRWAIEAFWVKEVSTRPFAQETSPEVMNTYNWDNCTFILCLHKISRLLLASSF